jgi:hypothetical protein
MGMTQIKGKVVTVEQPSYVLYTAFSDMRNFVMALPPDKKENVVATENTIEGEVQGMRMGLQIAHKTPFSSLMYQNYGNTPFEFGITIFFDAIDSYKTAFHIEVNADLPMMVKMMIGGKLQDAVDQMTEQLGLAFRGKIDPSKIDAEAFAEEMRKRYS